MHIDKLLTDVMHRTIESQYCSPVGAACGVSRENTCPLTRIAPQAAQSVLRRTSVILKKISRNGSMMQRKHY